MTLTRLFSRVFSRALDSSRDRSQFLSVIGDDFIGNGQQGSQLRPRYQVALGAQNKPLEFGEPGSGHVGKTSTELHNLAIV
jgi:hypothetical protein